MDLTTPIIKLSFIGPVYSRRLKKLNIETLGDLLLHTPSRYLDFRLSSDISRLQIGETVTIKGQIGSFKNVYTKKGNKIQEAIISDSTGKITAIWFNQPFLIRSLKVGMPIALAGKVGWFSRIRAFVSPEYELIKNGQKLIHTGSLIPIYPETAGISSKWLRSRIYNFFPQVKENIIEFLPEELRTEQNLMDLQQAYERIHFPQQEEEAISGKKRLSFDELLSLHLRSLYRKSDWRKNEAAYKLAVNSSAVKQFIISLSFKLTSSQQRAIQEILNDLQKDYPMNRLLEGDVGSGKTVVAASAAYAAFLNGTQTVIMAPTQILAQQHFNTLNNILHSFKVRVSLITSDGIKADPGRSDIFVGTHALIHKKVNFEKVSLVIIDEQHRFGVEQRTHLIKLAGKKKKAPHVLTMTATPIPRTIALTLYGDLDLSTLTEMPKNRIPVKTWVVPTQKRESGYKWIGEQIEKEKIQVFVVCPLIEESEKDTMKQVKAATKEIENLKKYFPERRLGLLHGKIKSKEKEEILNKFREGKIDILVTTPVVEVGIDVPNANIMIIEAADRFGLASLHQLRGRVGRGGKESYCLLFAEKSLSRLAAMEKSMSGPQLAELDLKMRGPGEVFGVRQHGFPDLKIASWQDFELIKKTKKLADEIFENPSKYPSILHHFFPKRISLN
ncbi:ATP-dependent DNA helicase RecG [Candidatus Woesebacteria bacterium]|nr:ATP-dependent DNA helicase RecG [Candidatus Woesebacteria bacterium]